MNPRALLAAVIVTLFAGPAAADNNIEFVTGPVVSSNRITGMGGAFISVAEGADAHLINPASFAMRYTWVRDDRFDWDWSLYWLLGSDGTVPDLSGDADAAGHKPLFFGGGIDARYSWFGAGLHIMAKNFTFEATQLVGGEPVSNDYTFTQTFFALGMAYTIDVFDLTVGTSFNSVGSAVGVVEPESTVLALTGAGVTLGAVWAPRGKPYRVGLTARSPVFGVDQDIAPPEDLEGGLQVDSVVVPGRLGLGFSTMLWERRYNPTVTFGDPERYGDDKIDRGGRRYVLIAADLVMDGTSQDAIGLLSFLDGDPEQAGEKASFSPRLGVESEFWANQMRVRGGSYFEPSRVDSQSGRLHGTAGVDFRVPLVIDWRVNAVVDVARDYFNWGLGVGFWH